MKLNIHKLSDIYDKGGILKEILDVLLDKAIKNGDTGFKQIFYGFGFYEFEDGEIEDTEKVLNVPLLLDMNSELRNLILTQIKTLLSRSGEDHISPFFDEFLEESKLFIPYKDYKKFERKYKLNEIEKK